MDNGRDNGRDQETKRKKPDWNVESPRKEPSISVKSPQKTCRSLVSLDAHWQEHCACLSDAPCTVWRTYVVVNDDIVLPNVSMLSKVCGSALPR